MYVCMYVAIKVAIFAAKSISLRNFATSYLISFRSNDPRVPIDVFEVDVHRSSPAHVAPSLSPLTRLGTFTTPLFVGVLVRGSVFV